MTRFARAKGSKASNERAPEDSTPWEVMKQQLQQSKKENEDYKNRQAAEQQRLENYQSFLKEQKTQKKKAVWCDFPEIVGNQKDSQPPKKKKKSEEKQTNQDTNDPTEIVVNPLPTEKKNKKQKKQKSQSINNTEVSPSENTEKKLTEEKPISRKKGKKAKKSGDKNNSEQTAHSQTELTNEDKIDKTPAKAPENVKKKKKRNKFVNGKPARRKEINDRSFQLIVNGKEVELIRFDRFPIMKKDAEHLQELKNSMMKKGIPKSEVQRTMKLERRRAEKALARLKRDVCYNCRKGGHNLSDCPELKSKIPGVGVADGVCFKCGSTEHKQFECKVQKDKEFKFATCFICKEPGHIARQCPDNPKGLYPNGGSCKLCGDVTHLRKDCPTDKDKKEESSVKLSTLDSDNNIEDIGQQAPTSVVGDVIKKPKKIKF